MTDIRIEILTEEVKNLYKDLAESQKILTRFYVEKGIEQQKYSNLVAKTDNCVRLMREELDGLQQSLKEADFHSISKKIEQYLNSYKIWNKKDPEQALLQEPTGVKRFTLIFIVAFDYFSQ